MAKKVTFFDDTTFGLNTALCNDGVSGDIGSGTLLSENGIYFTPQTASSTATEAQKNTPHHIAHNGHIYTLGPSVISQSAQKISVSKSDTENANNLLSNKTADNTITLVSLLEADRFNKTVTYKKVDLDFSNIVNSINTLSVICKHLQQQIGSLTNSTNRITQYSFAISRLSGNTSSRTTFVLGESATVNFLDNTKEPATGIYNNFTITSITYNGGNASVSYSGTTINSLDQRGILCINTTISTGNDFTETAVSFKNITVQNVPIKTTVKCGSTIIGNADVFTNDNISLTKTIKDTVGSYATAIRQHWATANSDYAQYYSYDTGTILVSTNSHTTKNITSTEKLSSVCINNSTELTEIQLSMSVDIAKYIVEVSLTGSAVTPQTTTLTLNADNITSNIKTIFEQTTSNTVIHDIVTKWNDSTNYSTLVKSDDITLSNPTFNDLTTGSMPHILKVSFEVTGNVIYPSSISANKNSISLSLNSQSDTITATILPNNVSNKNVNWKISDSSVASISGATGNTKTVTSGTGITLTAAKAGGSTTLTYTAAGKTSVRGSITVTTASSTQLSITNVPNTTVTTSTNTGTYNVTPNSSVNQTISWSATGCTINGKTTGSVQPNTKLTISYNNTSTTSSSNATVTFNQSAPSMWYTNAQQVTLTLSIAKAEDTTDRNVYDENMTKLYDASKVVTGTDSLEGKKWSDYSNYIVKLNVNEIDMRVPFKVYTQDLSGNCSEFTSATYYEAGEIYWASVETVQSIILALN